MGWRLQLWRVYPGLRVTSGSSFNVDKLSLISCVGESCVSLRPEDISLFLPWASKKDNRSEVTKWQAAASSGLPLVFLFFAYGEI